MLIKSEEDLVNTLPAIKESLDNGNVICIPTDTVFGLAAYNDNKKGVDKIYGLKQRDKSKNLPVLAASVDDLIKFGAHFDDNTKKIAEKFWPGELTMILDCKPMYQSDKEIKNIAVRIPNNKIAIKILTYTGPLAVTSANISNEREIESIEKLEKVFQEAIPFYINDNIKKSNKSSTIIKISSSANPEEPAKLEIIREGNIAKKTIEDILYNKNVCRGE